MAIANAFRRWFPRLAEVIVNSRYRRSFKRNFYIKLGYIDDHWLRTAQTADWLTSMRALGPSGLDALEISPGDRSQWSGLGFRTYDSVQYPAFDICEMTTQMQYDVIIADNVLEHVKRPHKAVANVLAMLRPGGVFYVTTPFLVMVHGDDDYYRWTTKGMHILLEDAGFPAEEIDIKSWGNRSCIKANFDKWAVHGWHRDMRNEDHLPAVIWGTARKASE